MCKKGCELAQELLAKELLINLWTRKNEEKESRNQRIRAEGTILEK